MISSQNNLNDGKMELKRNDTLIDDFGDAFEIVNDMCYGDFNKVMKDPFMSDVIDFVMPIFTLEWIQQFCLSTLTNFLPALILLF